MASDRLRIVLRGMAELYGRKFSPESAAILLDDLSEYSEDQVIVALGRCRRELRTFPTLADIADRIQGEDGRPGPDEAWAMLPKSENETAVWTAEMRDAFNTVRALMDSDPIAARMAFKETYGKLLSQARAENREVEWQPTLGLDPQQRARAILDAVAKKRLPESHARDLLPELKPKPDPKQVQIEGAVEASSSEVALTHIHEVIASISGTDQPVRRKDAPPEVKMTWSEEQARREFLREQAKRLSEKDQGESA